MSEKKQQPDCVQQRKLSPERTKLVNACTQVLSEYGLRLCALLVIDEEDQVLMVVPGDVNEATLATACKRFARRIEQ